MKKDKDEKEYYIGGVLSKGVITEMYLGSRYSNIKIQEEVSTGLKLEHRILVENEIAEKLKLGQKVKLYMVVYEKEA